VITLGSNPPPATSKITEVEIEGQNRALFPRRPGEDLGVTEPFEPQLDEMSSVVSKLPEDSNRGTGHSNVGQKLQRRSAVSG